MAASFGPEALVRHKRARAAAEAAAALRLPTTKGGRLKTKVGADSVTFTAQVQNSTAQVQTFRDYARPCGNWHAYA
jgi:hypothetical protein